MAWCRVRLVGADGRLWKAGIASRAISAASRKPPSVTTPATPRIISREIRIEPAEAARASLRLSITSRSEEHTSELQSLMRISYAVFCLKKKKLTHTIIQINLQN